jgi:hypothetical protein
MTIAREVRINIRKKDTNVRYSNNFDSTTCLARSFWVEPSFLILPQHSASLVVMVLSSGSPATLTIKVIVIRNPWCLVVFF